MIGILSNDYTNTQPIAPTYKALCVFDVEAAKIAFNYCGVDFVFVMNETSGVFGKCNNLKEVIDFINMEAKNELLKSLIGMTKEEGYLLCKEKGFEYRITREDSTNYAITMDLCFDRINLAIDNGRITKCNLG
jgi:hypothetical protein